MQARGRVGLAAMLLHLNELFASGSATTMVGEHSQLYDDTDVSSLKDITQI
jgi:hypothetical protein